MRLFPAQHRYTLAFSRSMKGVGGLLGACEVLEIRPVPMSLPASLIHDLAGSQGTMEVYQQGASNGSQ